MKAYAYILDDVIITKLNVIELLIYRILFKYINETYNVNEPKVDLRFFGIEIKNHKDKS